MNSSTDREPDRAIKGTLNHLSNYLEDYHECFRNETFDGYELCRFYINGLFKAEAGKRNMERINEEIEMPGDSYQKVQQFITNSLWSSENVIRLVAQNTSDQYEDQPDYRFRDVGYIIDESAPKERPPFRRRCQAIRRCDRKSRQLPGWSLLKLSLAVPQYFD